ncbi:hypothetical protein ACFW2V_40475 [Streptomyces sp. NPDC058947]|uniref:hypothetical protein n=1 Tax=Streptomyces sp. NPDC058947 TaxID=3346675 RepID=UPI003679FE4C
MAGEPARQFELGVGESQGAGQCPQDVGTGVSNALWWLPTIRAEDRVYDASDPGKTVPVDTFDIARVAAVALTQDGHAGAYIINGPQALTAREQVEILADVLGRTIEFVPLTPEQFAQHSIEQGTPAGFAAQCRTSTSSSAPDAPESSTNDITHLTGITPRHLPPVVPGPRRPIPLI